jgi:hypothetical protein
MLIDMQSKLSRNSSIGVSKSLVLQIRHNRSMEKENITHITKGRARRFNLKKMIPRNQLRRVMGSLRKTLESGVNFIKSLGTTMMNVA